MLVGINSGMGQTPNCLAGETPVTFSDGTEGCQLTLTAQSLGVNAPNCSYGQAYIDPTTADWACPVPPAPQSQSSTGLFIVAAIIAVFAWQYFVPKTAKSVSHLSKGSFQDFLPGGTS